MSFDLHARKSGLLLPSFFTMPAMKSSRFTHTSTRRFGGELYLSFSIFQLPEIAGMQTDLKERFREFCSPKGQNGAEKLQRYSSSTKQTTEFFASKYLYTGFFKPAFYFLLFDAIDDQQEHADLML